ncbi:MAG: hypothetical protein PHH08_00855 [Candidatus ainarchaeum sp.]|nr:hypothetical protein [Candidatus ainarchaeum sp.]
MGTLATTESQEITQGELQELIQRLANAVSPADAYVILSTAETGTTQTCTSFTYSNWGACSNGTQTRNILFSTPNGCTGGNPILSQTCSPACTETSWTPDSCTICNGTSFTQTSNCETTRTSTGTKTCTQTCTSFTYSNWGACNNGTQTRNILSQTPTGCTGGNPILNQACTPAQETCGAYSGYPLGEKPNCLYGANHNTGQAKAAGTKIIATILQGNNCPELQCTCQGTTTHPAQAGWECTISQTAQACTSFNYSDWSACTNGIQTRTILSSSPAGCTNGNPTLAQTCTTTGTCTTKINGTTIRTTTATGTTNCYNQISYGSNNCAYYKQNYPNSFITGTNTLEMYYNNTRINTETCTQNPPTCTGFTYSAWNACSNGTQTRNILSQTPTGCTGGNPILSQTCATHQPERQPCYICWGILGWLLSCR